MKMFKICKTCLKGQPILIPLAIAKEGNKLIIKDFIGGIKANMRLINMGLRIGDYINVITNSGHGQVMIALGHMRLLLGRGVAQKILVERI
ncbi:Fur family transcriptional regulator [Candidatus Magnetomorum sp. HK-1]|nr:Fur family transcriptional regulator [Candidatus Magnetomorum sp. HK-1]